MTPSLHFSGVQGTRRYQSKPRSSDCKSVSSNPPQAPIGDDNSDDNPDDSCTINDRHDCSKTVLSGLVG